MVTKENEKSKSPETPKVEEVKEIKVTLVNKGQNQWRVLGADGKDLLCNCGRPVVASLHNVSVSDTTLGPCEKVVITKQ